jgi:hypothetical protein
MTEHSVVEETREFISRQRATLLKEREVLFAEQQALQERLAALNEVLSKFDMFESKSPARRVRLASSSRGQARRGSRREGIIAVLMGSPDGLSRREILEQMGLKGDKSSETSVSNALTGLTKTNKVRRRDKKYVAV